MALFQPGQSGNPGGKPKGARNKLQADFMKRLAEDFDAYGEEAIRRMREEEPASYIKAIVALMPKELEVSRTVLEDLDDDQLAASIAAIRALHAAQALGDGAGEAPQLQ